jgi:hypothetical protein
MDEHSQLDEWVPPIVCKFHMDRRQPAGTLLLFHLNLTKHYATKLFTRTP